MGEGGRQQVLPPTLGREPGLGQVADRQQVLPPTFRGRGRVRDRRASAIPPPGPEPARGVCPHSSRAGGEPPDHGGRERRAVVSWEVSCFPGPLTVLLRRI